MTGHWSTILAAGLTAGLVSCTAPARETPVKQATAAPVKEKVLPVPPKPRGKITSISMANLFTLHQTDQVLLFDARPSFFYSLGHIQGAISMPKGGSVAHIGQREAEIKAALAAGKTIVFYCTNAACPDARAVAVNLSGFGYPCSVLVGGYESWKESGLPVE